MAGALGTVLALSVLAGCIEPTPPVPPPPAVIDGEVDLEWWAMGDSLFAGYAGEPGAPDYLSGVEVLARSGNTLVEVQLFGAPQATVRQQIAGAIDRHGTPERMLIHAGVADLAARAVWGLGAPLDRYTEEVLALDEWLSGLGVEVYWVTLAPHAATSMLAATGQDALRRQLNDFLRGQVDGRVVDCDAALLDPDGRWIDRNLVQSFDGIHVNRAGALSHARCISAALAERHGLDIPVVTAGG